MGKNKPHIGNGNNLGLVNVLITRFSALGDVAMTIPVIYSVCRCSPDIRFIMVTKPSMTGIFINSPSNLKVIGADVKNDYVGIRGLWRLLSELKQQYSIDAYVDLHDVLRTKLLRLFSRIRGIKASRLNKGRRNKKALTRQNSKVMLPLISSRARYREAFFKVGLPVQEHFDGLYGAGGKADPMSFAMITLPKQSGSRWVGIAPFAAHKGKIYPPEKMEEVVKGLINNPDVYVFLLGGGGEEQRLLETWSQKYPRTTSLAGKRYGFEAELALMSHMDVVLAMDSANMHLSSIVGTKVVSIWGATHPYCGFKGWRQSDGDTIQLAMTCRPCSVFGDKPCQRGDYHCLNGIRPSLVLEKLQRYL